MNGMLSYVVAVIAGAVLGGLLVYLWCSRKAAVLDERLAQMTAANSLNEEHRALSVRVEPYVRLAGKSGFIKKSTETELGYQYQLFVRGLPCFEPHVIIVERRQESVIDQAALERLKNHAYGLAQAAVEAKAGGAGSLISVVKAVSKMGK